MTEQPGKETEPKPSTPGQPGRPVCGGVMIDIRGKLQCTRCHRICETCCEGGHG